MKNLARHLAVAITAMIFTGSGLTGADETAQAGRELAEKYAPAVVTVRIVVNQSLTVGAQTSPKQEQKLEATGTVIDPSGLTVLSFTTTSPGTAARDAYAKMLASRGGDPSLVKVDSEVTDVKLLAPDGSEIPAAIVLRDEDLDLAFVRPLEAPKKPLSYVALTDGGVLQLLDPVYVVNRLGKSANRVPAISAGRVEAVLDRPRTFYILGNVTWAYSLGAPVFAADGKVVGIIVLRTSKAPSEANFGFVHGHLSNLLPVVIAASDIQETAKQALAVTVTQPKASAAPTADEGSRP